MFQIVTNFFISLLSSKYLLCKAEIYGTIYFTISFSLPESIGESNKKYYFLSLYSLFMWKSCTSRYSIISNFVLYFALNFTTNNFQILNFSTILRHFNFLPTFDSFKTHFWIQFPDSIPLSKMTNFSVLLSFLVQPFISSFVHAFSEVLLQFNFTNQFPHSSPANVLVRLFIAPTCPTDAMLYCLK